MPQIAAVVIALFIVCQQAEGRPQGGETDRARADALRALKGGDERPVSQDLERSKVKWPAYDREIEAGIVEQQSALDQGGRRVDDMLTLYQNRARMEETPPALYLYGRFLGLLDRIDEATKQFEAALRVDPYFPWAHHGIATSFAKNGKFGDAVRAYRRALELNPSFQRSMEPLAACLVQIEQFDEAERVLRKLLEIRPDEIQGWLTLGKLQSGRTRHADAIASFRTVLNKKPGHEEARRLLAYSLRKAAQPEEAKAVYLEMLRENPKDFRARMGLAETLYQAGENHAAADEYEKALENWSATSGISKGDIVGRVEELRRMPAVEKRDPRQKSPHEWVEILLNSTEPERCREAIRVLSTYPLYDEEIYKSFLKALKNKDTAVRVLAIKELQRRYEGLLHELTPLLSIFVVDDGDRLVRAMAARNLGQSGDPAAVPALVKALKDRDPYVFREVYDALWKLTSSDMSALLPEELTPEVMDKLGAGWLRWYEENRDRYRKYEPAGK